MKTLCTLLIGWLVFSGLPDKAIAQPPEDVSLERFGLEQAIREIKHAVARSPLQAETNVVLAVGEKRLSSPGEQLVALRSVYQIAAGLFREPAIRDATPAIRKIIAAEFRAAAASMEKVSRQAKTIEEMNGFREAISRFINLGKRLGAEEFRDYATAVTDAVELRGRLANDPVKTSFSNLLTTADTLVSKVKTDPAALDDVARVVRVATFLMEHPHIRKDEDAATEVMGALDKATARLATDEMAAKADDPPRKAVFGDLLIAHAKLDKAWLAKLKTFDWKHWRGLPVLHRGRVMPIDSFANEAVTKVTKKSKWADIRLPKELQTKFPAHQLVFLWLTEGNRLSHERTQGWRGRWLYEPILLCEFQPLRRILDTRLSNESLADGKVDGRTLSFAALKRTPVTAGSVSGKILRDGKEVASFREGDTDLIVITPAGELKGSSTLPLLNDLPKKHGDAWFGSVIRRAFGTASSSVPMRATVDRETGELSFEFSEAPEGKWTVEIKYGYRRGVIPEKGKYVAVAEVLDLPMMRVGGEQSINMLSTDALERFRQIVRTNGEYAKFSNGPQDLAINKKLAILIQHANEFLGIYRSSRISVAPALDPRALTKQTQEKPREAWLTFGALLDNEPQRNPTAWAIAAPDPRSFAGRINYPKTNLLQLARVRQFRHSLAEPVNRVSRSLEAARAALDSESPKQFAAATIQLVQAMRKIGKGLEESRVQVEAVDPRIALLVVDDLQGAILKDLVLGMTRTEREKVINEIAQEKLKELEGKNIPRNQKLLILSAFHRDVEFQDQLLRERFAPKAVEMAEKIRENMQRHADVLDKLPIAVPVGASDQIRLEVILARLARFDDLVDIGLIPSSEELDRFKKLLEATRPERQQFREKNFADKSIAAKNLSQFQVLLDTGLTALREEDDSFVERERRLFETTPIMMDDGSRMAAGVDRLARIKDLLKNDNALLKAASEAGKSVELQAFLTDRKFADLFDRIEEYQTMLKTGETLPAMGMMRLQVTVGTLLHDLATLDPGIVERHKSLFNEPIDLGPKTWEAVAEYEPAPLHSRQMELSEYPEEGATDLELFFNDVQPFSKAWLFFFTAFAFMLAALILKWKKTLFSLSVFTTIASLGWSAWGFSLRVRISQFAPVTNMYETIIWVAFVVGFLGLWFALLPYLWPGLSWAWRLSSLPIKRDRQNGGFTRDIPLGEDRVRRYGEHFEFFQIASSVVRLALFTGALLFLTSKGTFQITELYPGADGREVTGSSITIWSIAISMIGLACWYTAHAAVALLLAFFVGDSEARRANRAADGTQSTKLWDQTWARRWYLLGSLPVAGLGMLLAWQAGIHSSDMIDPKIGNLQAVLRDNYWLTIHVLTIVSSYAAGALAWIMGNVALGYYAFGRYRKTTQVVQVDEETAAGGVWSRVKKAGATLSPKKFGKAIKSGLTGLGKGDKHLEVASARPPKEVATLANYSYKAMQVAVLLLAAGTILGGLWADVSWGRFWDWDPKEVWALISLLVYLAVLHGRFAGWTGTFGTSAGAVLCFDAIIMSWYGVNFILPKIPGWIDGSGKTVSLGMHSYAGGEGDQGLWYVVGAIALNFVFVVVAFGRYMMETKQTLVVDGASADDAPAE